MFPNINNLLLLFTAFPELGWKNRNIIDSLLILLFCLIWGIYFLIFPGLWKNFTLLLMVLMWDVSIVLSIVIKQFISSMPFVYFNHFTFSFIYGDKCVSIKITSQLWSQWKELQVTVINSPGSNISNQIAWLDCPEACILLSYVLTKPLPMGECGNSPLDDLVTLLVPSC